ncbi:MAG: TRAP transporter large permease subunit [Casimicrobiaceae bacterium]|nr:TRAP transporter large permease subunit [Casimicrobiaceae bacterium]MCX8098110.1 TRAP transporter large permease subunit [Casimicrobiaceae bacterium]
MTLALFIGVLLGTIALGFPIAFALLACGVALMAQLGIFDAQILAQNLLEGANSFPLLAVPFFMLAGELMNAGGLSRRIVELALVFVGHVRGGLGYVVIVAAVIMAALSGSAVADAAALASLLVPMMVAAGYDRARSGGLIAASAVIAPVIPPSIGLVLFGVAGNVSIAKLFLAGIVPGLLLALALWLVWGAQLRTQAAPVRPRASARERWRALREAVWALGLPLIVIVGLKFGVFTPTEAAVVAAVYALAVSTLVYRELTWGRLYEVFLAAAKTTAVIMFLVAAAMVSAWLINVAQLPQQVLGLVEPLIDSPRLLVAVIMLLVIAIGMAMDMTPTILILTPVLMPVIKAAGVDPVYFGVLFVINCSIGLITPPVGTVLNTVAGVGRIPLEALARGALPFVVAQLAVLFLLVAFPPIVTVPLAWLTS